MDENSVEYYGAYYLGALLAAKKVIEQYVNKPWQGENKVYRDAELALITQSKRTMELFMDGTPIRYRNHERDKKGKLTKCEAYFYKEQRIIQEVT